jgi:hypothetical protein
VQGDIGISMAVEIAGSDNKIRRTHWRRRSSLCVRRSAHRSQNAKTSNQQGNYTDEPHSSVSDGMGVWKRLSLNHGISIDEFPCADSGSCNSEVIVEHISISFLSSTLVLSKQTDVGRVWDFCMRRRVSLDL